MNLYRKRIISAFFASLVLTLFAPLFSSLASFHYYFPFLILLIYKKPLLQCLWGAMAFGLILDILSPSDKMGIHAVALTVTAGILYTQKKHFFADSLSTLPIMTFMFSTISTCFAFLLTCFFEKTLVITTLWLFTDLVIFPLSDAAIAFSLFILPAFLLGPPERQGNDYFLKERPTETTSTYSF